MAVAEAFTQTLPTRTGRTRSAARPRRRLDRAAAGLLGLVTIVALAAPILAPHGPLTPVGQPSCRPAAPASCSAATPSAATSSAACSTAPAPAGSPRSPSWRSDY